MKTYIYLFLILAFFYFGCDNVKEDIHQPIAMELLPTSDGVEASMFISDMALADVAPPKNYSYSSIGVFNVNQKFIKDANLRYHIEDLENSVTVTKNLTKSLGGYISRENENRRNRLIETTLTLKIPSDNFDSFIDSLTLIVGDFESKSVNVKDVTEEYIDTQTRIENKRKVEDKFRELIKRANEVEDLLQIEQSLGKIREEIESAEKRLTLLTNQINYSTIKVQLYRIDETMLAQNERSFFRYIIPSLKKGWFGIMNTILFLLSIWPILLLIVFSYFVLKRYLRRRKSKVLENTV